MLYYGHFKLLSRAGEMKDLFHCANDALRMYRVPYNGQYWKSLPVQTQTLTGLT